MGQHGGTVRMNVKNVTLLVCVVTLVMVTNVLFKTCLNDGFRDHNENGNGGCGADP